MATLRSALLLLLAPLCAQALELREGVGLNAAYTNEVLGKVAGSGRRGVIDEGLFGLGLSLDLEKLAHWPGATFFANAYYAHGPSLTDRYVGDLNVLSNIDAYDTLRLNELGLQQTFFDDRLSLRLGLLVIDTDFYVCEPGSNFVNSAFGAISLLAVNTGAPTFPVSAPGARLEWKITPELAVRVAAYSGDVGSQDRTNTHGGRFTFSSESGGLYFGEIERHFKVGHDLPGIVRLGGFYHSGLFDDLSGAGGRERGLGCTYAVWDQAIYRIPAEPKPKQTADQEDDARGINLFIRGGVAWPPDRALIGSEIEIGLAARGLFASRKHDAMGLAFCWSRIGDDVREIDGEPVTSDHEAIIEGTYKFAATDWLSLQPDAQIIFNPGATTRANTAVVIGLRATLSF